MLVVLAVASNALARSFTGTNRADRLTGTRFADSIDGRAGNDRLLGVAGPDLIVGGLGRDVLSGGPGNDFLAAHLDRARDDVFCGRGRDIVNAELTDRVASDCEVVSRQVSRDPYTDTQGGGQHETQVEPDSFAFGSTIVTVFQTGRKFSGGASNIGWATSTNAGRTWRAGFLPGTTVVSSPPGNARLISDPAVAYDSVHRVWLISTLSVSPNSTDLPVHRSATGLAWTGPITAATSPGQNLAFDKNWIACDNGPVSPFRGRCYIVYTDVRTDRAAVLTTSDGGLTWSQPVHAPAGPQSRPIVGVQPVVLPDGTLLIPYSFTPGQPGQGEQTLASVRSLDGGASLTQATQVATLQPLTFSGLRAFPLPSAEVDGSGRAVVAWHSCRFQQPSCRVNDIVYSTSRDGVAWTPVRRVPTAPLNTPRNAFMPGLAADPRSTRLAIVYYSTRTVQCALVECVVDVFLIQSSDGGTRWGAPQRLNAEGMKIGWIANTESGRMFGDYLSTSYVGGRPIPVFSLAGPPVGRNFRQATFVTTRVR